jgi:type IV fimbrial biogenesis protein FimT
MTLMSEISKTLTMNRAAGFTLVELLITIVVVSILLALGAPAFKDFIKNNRVTAQTNDLVSAIQLARSEALKRGTNMVVCASKDQKTCSKNKDTWTDGWIVFSDLGQDAVPVPDVGTGHCLETEDCIVATRASLPSGSTLTSPVGNFNLCFLPAGLSGTHVDGTCTSQTTVEIEFILKAKNCEKNQARKITVNKQGRTQVLTCSSCACS